MRTWGQIRFELSKFTPGVDLDLLTGWIQAAYNEILDSREWSGLNQLGVLSTVAPYRTGTVTMTSGSSSVTGSGTQWSGVTDRKFRVIGETDSYDFTPLSDTTASLDRVYTGPSGTGVTYELYRSVVALPSWVKYVVQVTGWAGQPMDRKGVNELNLIAGARTAFGVPEVWAPATDASDVVTHRIEFFPVPDCVLALPYRYQKAVVSFDGTNTSSIPLPWVSDDAIMAGARSRALGHQKDYNGSQLARTEYDLFLRRMNAVETERIGPAHLQMARRYTNHRARRWIR